MAWHPAVGWSFTADFGYRQGRDAVARGRAAKARQDVTVLSMMRAASGPRHAAQEVFELLTATFLDNEDV